MAVASNWAPTAVVTATLLPIEKSMPPAVISSVSPAAITATTLT